MCFTFIGRIHTRLATLLGPLFLAWFFTVVTAHPDYWTLFVLMACVGLALDAGVYGWIIGYQPRWLTLGLAVCEFVILKWIMEWPYPFEIRLRTRQALWLYILSWILIWITLHAVLPLLWPRWIEDGGEFRLARRYKTLPFFKISYHLAQRRQAYGQAMLVLGIASLPWLTAYLRTPTGYHCTGLLLLETGHLHALAHAVVGKIQPGSITSIATSIGWIAHTGRWAVLPVYTLAVGVAAFAWLLGCCLYTSSNANNSLLLVAAGGGPILVLPLHWLCTAALVVWITLLFHLPRQLRLPRQVLFPLCGMVVLLWGLAWGRIATAPLLYVDEGTWQAMIWLNQHVPAYTTVAVPVELHDLVAALSGQHVVDPGAEATLQLRRGPVCDTAVPRFRHGTSCILEGNT